MRREWKNKTGREERRGEKKDISMLYKGPEANRVIFPNVLHLQCEQQINMWWTPDQKWERFTITTANDMNTLHTANNLKIETPKKLQT